MLYSILALFVLIDAGIKYLLQMNHWRQASYSFNLAPCTQPLKCEAKVFFFEMGIDNLEYYSDLYCYFHNVSADPTFKYIFSNLGRCIKSHKFKNMHLKRSEVTLVETLKISQVEKSSHNSVWSISIYYRKGCVLKVCFVHK